jgi:Carboxypeptidase regulatory-like domain
MSQGDRGQITGTVTDGTGAVVPNAQITAVQKNTNSSYKTVTTSAGVFTLNGLSIGDYTVSVEKQGFKIYIANAVEVTPGGSTGWDVVLQVGMTSQSIEITAAAQVLQTENARVSSTVSATLVNDLPVLVNGSSRTPFDIASTTPEVSATGGFHIGGGNNALGVSLDGASMAGGKVGADVGDAGARLSPSVEALTEFTVESSGFKAESGHASGGTISFVSKSGTNQIHGSAYEFLRNQDLDARSFFQSTRNIYKQSNFGATLGGPVYIPKLYNGKNKTFFFGSYEGFRNRNGASSGTFLSVPTPEMYNGDFSNWVDGNNKLYPIYDPRSQTLVNGNYVRTPFPGNKINTQDFDPVAAPIAKYLSTIIAPNRPGSNIPGTSAYVRNNYISSGSSLQPSDKWSAKADENLGSKHHLSYLMNRSKTLNDFGPSGSTGLPIPIGGDVGTYKADLYRGNWDYTVSPTLINRFYGGFNHYLENQGGTSREVAQTTATGNNLLPAGYWKGKGICIPGYPECSMFPPISTGDFSGWGDTGTNGSDRIVFEMHDDMSKSIGKHSLQWGYLFSNTHYDGFGVQNISGTTGFSFRNTSQAGAVNQASGGGNGFASFLLGQVNSDSLDTVRYVTLVYRTHQGYFQDDWKVTPKLTINFGARVDYNQPPSNGDGRLSDLSLTTANPGAGGRPGAIIFAGTGTGRVGSNSLIPAWSGAEPRIGIAYSLNNKTTIRASASRYYGPVEGINGSSHYLGFVVKSTAADTTNGIQPLWILKDGHPKFTPPPAIDPSVSNGQSAIPFWNGKVGNTPSAELGYSFNIQRQVTATSSFDVGYMSTLASDLTANTSAFNQVPYRSLPAGLSPFTTAGRAALGSVIGSAAANAAGAVAPWTCPAGGTGCTPFNTLWGSQASATQAYRPFPMYGSIDSYAGGGGRIGHSTYHSLILKYNKRTSHGLTVQASYKLSKWLGDADAGIGDMYNLRLLKSIMGSDQTHVVQASYSYELPIGKGKALLGNGGVAAYVLGGWRIAGIHSYASGTPMSIGGSASFGVLGEITNPTQITTYDGWRASIKGSKFDPNVDSFLDPSVFPVQNFNGFGNATRFNPKMRNWPNYNENINLARTFSLKEKAHLEFRAEAFNLFNRVAFGALGGGNTIANANFGKWQTQANSPRRMQVVAKLTW